MPRKRKAVEGALISKGFVQNDTHHRQFVYYSGAGKKTTFRTRTSHGMREISDPLLAQMAKQCGLNKKDFLDLVDCPLDRHDYESRIADKL